MNIGRLVVGATVAKYKYKYKHKNKHTHKYNYKSFKSNDDRGYP